MSSEATTPPWANKNSYVRDVLRPIEQHGDYINRATFWFHISKLCHKPKNVLLFNYSHLLRIFPWYIHKFFWVKLYQKFGNSSKKTTPARRPLPNPSRRADTIGKFGHERPWDAMADIFLNTMIFKYNIHAITMEYHFLIHFYFKNVLESSYLFTLHKNYSKNCSE